MENRLPVNLYGTTVGQLEKVSENSVQFHSSDEGIERFGVGSTVISNSLPLASRPSSIAAATNFFGGLLPEGRGLTNLAKQAGARNTDVYSLIHFAGLDVAGALQIGDLSNLTANDYVPIDDEEILARLDRTHDYALGAVGGGGSLAGYQLKTTLALIEDQWCTTVGGAASTHVLKPADSDFEQALVNENFCLALGRDLGLLAFESHLQRFGKRLVLVIERYDRQVKEAHVERIHQEDAAQALSLPWNSDSKFEGVDAKANLKAVAGLLPRTRRAFATEPGDHEKLLAFITFNTAIGNTDAHAKNVSFIHSKYGRASLAPLYDASTHALTAGGQQNMALRINNKSFQPEIRAEDLVAEGVSWGLKEDGCEAVIMDTLLKLRQAVGNPEHVNVSPRTVSYIEQQTTNLIAGKRAGHGINQPPTLPRF